jgi:hypothetical protein
MRSGVDEAMEAYSMNAATRLIHASIVTCELISRGQHYMTMRYLPGLFSH